jgi:hypothetical protein
VGSQRRPEILILCTSVRIAGGATRGAAGSKFGKRHATKPATSAATELGWGHLSFEK